MITVKPQVGALFIDKISLTLDVPKQKQIEIVSKLKILNDNHGLYFKHSSTYKYSVNISLDDIMGNPSKIIFQCAPTTANKNKKIRFIRVEWNPSKINSSVVKSTLNQILPGIFHSLQSEGNITRIDLATDIKHVKPGNLLFYYPYIQCSQNYFKSGRIESAYLGTKDSDRQIVLYDKKEEQKKKNKKLPFPYPLPLLDLTRLEIRIRKAMSFAELLKIENPFANLQLRVSKTPNTGAGFDEYRLFRRLCIWEGVAQALKQLSSKEKQTKYLNRIMSELNEFWDPATLWLGLPTALEQAGFKIKDMAS